MQSFRICQSEVLTFRKQNKTKQKCLWLNIPQVSVLHSWLLPIVQAWIGRFCNSQQQQHPCHRVIQLLIQNALFQPACPGQQMAASPILNPAWSFQLDPISNPSHNWLHFASALVSYIHSAAVPRPSKHLTMMQENLHQAFADTASPLLPPGHELKSCPYLWSWVAGTAI